MKQPLHGGEVYALAHDKGLEPDEFLDFSSNANIFAKDITRALTEKTPYPFLHYPDTACRALRESIARHEKLEATRILPGNGATELIWLFLLHFTPASVLFIGPAFSEYVKACTVLGIPYTIITPPAQEGFALSAKELRQIAASTAELTVLCCPNNPATVTYQNIHSTLEILRSPMVFVDTSYREFLYGTPAYSLNTHHAYSAHLPSGTTLFTLNSFTKFFCCPGIRLGYLLGDAASINAMVACRPSWTVSPFAQTMGTLFLENIDAYRATLPALARAVEETGRGLASLAAFDPALVFTGPGFLCCGLHHSLTAEQAFLALLEKRIIVRNCDSIPGMPPGFLRVQARPSQDQNLLFAALRTLKS